MSKTRETVARLLQGLGTEEERQYIVNEIAVEIEYLQQRNSELLSALSLLVNAAYEDANKKQFAPFHASELAAANIAIAKSKGESA